MERLKSAYLLTLIALAAVPAAAQQTAQPGANVCTFAVVGDIENCRTYSVPSGIPLTVRQAVLDAGLVSESANVVVIRAAQDHPEWTQLVSAISADSGERVETGDVLVVQAMSPLTAPVTKNAAVRSDMGVAVVSLEHEGIVMGDILQQTQTRPPADGQLKVICRFPGQTPITKAELWHAPAHGDVISVSRSNRAVLKGFGSMSPSASEWKSSEPRDPFHAMTVASSNQSTSRHQSMSQPAQLPIVTERFNDPVGQDVKLTEDVSEPDHELEIPAVLIPALSASTAEDIEDTGATDDEISPATETTANAPPAPSEIRIDTVTSPATTTFNRWNLVFISGLLLSGIMILAGTLKPETEDESASDNTADQIKTSAPAQASRPTWTERPGLQNEALTGSQHTAKLTNPERSIPADTGEQVPKALVAGHEWFSGDWQGKAESGELSTQPTAANGESAALSSDKSHAQVAAVSSENTVASDVESVKSHAPGEQGFAELEDLVQNRMPIDLYETQLSLRMALFGKPAGPRSLRIDQAHPTITAPHLNLTPRPARAESAALTNGGTGQTGDSGAPPVVDSSGSLDRALHFLHERTES